MKKNLKTLFALLLMVLAVVPALAQRHFSMDIWLRLLIRTHMPTRHAYMFSFRTARRLREGLW